MSIADEYQRRVVARLDWLAEELGSEFYPDSENFWVNHHSIDDAVKRVKESVFGNRKRILESGQLGVYPVSREASRSFELIMRIKSDPFLPEPIRSSVVGALKRRNKVLSKAYQETFDDYAVRFAQGEYADILGKDNTWLLNQIDNYCGAHGQGIGQFEIIVDGLRLDIQKYLESFV